MLVILAGDSDELAKELAESWEAAVITPSDLSRAGWRYELPLTGNAMVVASGQRILSKEIAGVLTRMPWVNPADLPGVAGEDRAYVAAEMNSFLAAWLDSLDCPVLNPPVFGCLCGPGSRMPFVNADQGDESVVVVGNRCFGQKDSRHSEMATRIALEAGVELMEAHFRNGSFLNAGLIPDLSRADVAAAVHELLTGPARSGRKIASRPNTRGSGSLILLWGLPADPPLCRVYRELLLLNAPVRLLDQRDVLDMRISRDIVTVRGELFSLNDVQSVYFRDYDSSQFPHVLEASEERRRHAAEVDAGITRWIEDCPAFVVSPLDAMYANSSKPYQLHWISQFGWRIPHTLITTDPSAARDFSNLHEDVIYKSISSIRSRVSRLTPGHEARFDDLTTCPTQFQEFIPGVDYRVHVVGDRIFGCRVLSEADDYRYSGDSGTDYIACQLPRDIEERCLRMSAAMDLPVSGIDLRLTPEGEWVCFEVNPSPGFTAFEEVTGQPIAAAIARLLVNPS